MRYECQPYCDMEITNKHIKYNLDLPTTIIFDTLEEAKIYALECLSKGFKSDIFKVEEYNPFPNAKSEKYRQVREYKRIEKIN